MINNVYQKGENIDFKLVAHSLEYVQKVNDFDCGIDTINEYIRNDSLHDTDTKTYLAVDVKTEDILGFASISCSGVHYSFDKSLHATIPAIEIKYFAITNELHKLIYDDTDSHFYFSDMVLCELLSKIRDISDNIIGARLVILYSVDAAKHFYERNMFQPYEQYMLKDNIRFLDGCTPMYMTL